MVLTDDESMAYGCMAKRKHYCDIIFNFRITSKYINHKMYSLYYIYIKFPNDRGTHGIFTKWS